MAGRPPRLRTQHYTDAILTGLRRGWHVAKICAMGRAGLLREGDEPDPQFPHRDLVFDWVGTDRQFAELYLEARRAGCEAMVDESFLIGDAADRDQQYVFNEAGDLVRVFDHEHINRSRLRVDLRKWYVAKLVPRLYGERIEHEHKGAVDVVTTRLAEGRARALGVVESNVLEGTFERVTESLPARTDEDDGRDLV